MLHWNILGRVLLLLVVCSVIVLGTPLLQRYGLIVSDVHQISDRFISGFLSTALIALLVANYRWIQHLVNRLTNPEDAYITGKWYIYRYSKKDGIVRKLVTEWKIGRDLFDRYRIYNSKTKDIYDEKTRDNDAKLSGSVVYNERDRLNILVTGANHKQQTLMCFQMNIPVNKKTRVLGVGVGDDADYVLGSRIYLASRAEINESAFSIIDEATSHMKQGDKLLQLPPCDIISIFEKYPPPEEPSSETAKRNAILSRLIASFVRQKHV
jgi:hypothetical protein